MNYDDLKQSITRVIRGEVSSDPAELAPLSRDASLFTRTPALVVYPKDSSDVATLVDEVARARAEGMRVSLTARAAGTCMSGGSLTTSVVMVCTRHLTKVDDISVLDTPRGHIAGYALTEPGVYYRDFEKATLQHGLILPSYPASRELAALGGMVANNAAGERTLEYGQTERYVEELQCVLSDGSTATFKALTPEEVADKKELRTLEGHIYREMDNLLTTHAALIEQHRPTVSKNAAGYALWSIRDARTGTTNMAKLIAGSQGTLALWTKAKLALVRPKEHRAMLVVFLKDLSLLPEIVNRVLPHHPESFESYDRHTFELAVKFIPQMLSRMGWSKAARLGIDFLPEIALMATGGVPEMILMAEFADTTIEAADARALAAEQTLAALDLSTKIEKDEQQSEKYWIVRRESFSLLRKNLRDLYPAPFIDDFVVPPSCYPEFLPKLYALLDEYKDHMVYTIAGHVGNGNFHLIPLMDLTNAESRQIILALAPKVYDLVINVGGTTTGEHNDGIIRTPYLPQLFGPQMVALFEQTKHIFDPQGIFNPGKKVGGTFADIERDMITTNSHAAAP